MKKKLVSIVMGSASDMPVMEEAIQMLTELKIGFEVIVTSAIVPRSEHPDTPAMLRSRESR